MKGFPAEVCGHVSVDLIIVSKPAPRSKAPGPHWQPLVRCQGKREKIAASSLDHGSGELLPADASWLLLVDGVAEPQLSKVVRAPRPQRPIQSNSHRV